MKDMRGREVRYQVVTNCGECVHCCFDTCDEVYRCSRHSGEPEVDPLGEPPEWCFLLSDLDIVSGFLPYDEAKELVRKKEEEDMRHMTSRKMEGENDEQ